jgi:hypothetical protein
MKTWAANGLQATGAALEKKRNNTIDGPVYEIIVTLSFLKQFFSKPRAKIHSLVIPDVFVHDLSVLALSLYVMMVSCVMIVRRLLDSHN